MPKSFMGSLYQGYKEREQGNHREALACFQAALEMETVSPIAAYEVARYYEEGTAVPQDLQKAFKLYLQAANGCVEMAQCKLADWYEQGIHVDQNAETARIWREKAVEQKKKDDEPPLTLAESIRKKIAEELGQ